MLKKHFSFEYCGKKYGVRDYIFGFFIGAFLGYIAFWAMYGDLKIVAFFSVLSGVLLSRIFVSSLINRRKDQFVNQFCDYLDSISGALSCGKNTYDAFISANEDMHELYTVSSPICYESGRLVRGLEMGTDIEELLYNMGQDSLCEDAKLFADVYSMCNKYGGNLKDVVAESKNTLLEKSAVESEISTALAAPRNELNIMAAMPFVITACMRFFKVGASDGEFIALDIFITVVFALSYFIGLKIVDIKV